MIPCVRFDSPPLIPRDFDTSLVFRHPLENGLWRLLPRCIVPLSQGYYGQAAMKTN